MKETHHKTNSVPLRKIAAWVAVSVMVFGHVGTTLHWVAVPHIWSPGLSGFVHSHDVGTTPKSHDDVTSIRAYGCAQEPDVCQTNAIRPSESTLLVENRLSDVVFEPDSRILPSLTIFKDRRNHLHSAPKTSPPAV